MGEHGHRALRRGGVVSAGALCIVLAGGGLSLGGAVPGSSESGAVVSSVKDRAGAVSEPTGALPAPAPQAAPAPVRDTVRQVVRKTTETAGAVREALAPAQPAPEPSGKPRPGTEPGDTASGHQPRINVYTPQRTTRKATDAAATGTVGAQRAAMQLPAQLRQRSGATTGAEAPVVDADFGTSGARGAVAPQLIPQLPSATDVPGTGDRGLPGVLVVIAVTSVAALGASHFGVWQNSRA